MYKKYGGKRVCSHRSYSVADLCEIYIAHNMRPKTLRDWINKHGLECFYDGRKIMIYGAVFNEFMDKRDEKRKRTLAFKEFRCGKCKIISEPVNNEITRLISSDIGSLIAYATCSCGHDFKKEYKKKRYPEIVSSFNVLLDEVAGLSDTLSSTSKSSLADASKTESSSSFLISSENTTTSTNKTKFQQQYNFMDML